jgi:hypothetical protein
MLVSKWQYKGESDNARFNMHLSLFLNADKYGNHNRGLHARPVDAEQQVCDYDKERRCFK